MTEQVPRRRSATLAATLSFVVPGLGQLALGSVRRGLLYLLPVAALVAFGAAVAAPDLVRFLGSLVRPDVLVGVFILNICLFAWRGLAIVDAWRTAAEGTPRGALTTLVVVALLLVTAATHVVVGATTYLAYDAVTAITGDEGFGALPAGPPASTPEPSPGATPTPTPVPTPSPPPLADGRLDILLMGADAGPYRWSLRADTLIVLSVDVETGRAAFFGIPRNLLNVPLPEESRGAFECGCFPGLINALYVYASGHPDEFPGQDETRGLRAVQGAIGELTGLQLDGMVVVKLEGFVHLVDAIGGLDIDVPEGVYDANYPLENGLGKIVLRIRPGPQHFDGRTALAYARSRHQDSDYGRMERQQITLTALGRQLMDQPLLTKVPELLAIARENLWTNLDIEDLPAFIELAQRVDVAQIGRFAFIPSKYPEFLDRAAIEGIRAEVAGVFRAIEPPVPTPQPTERPGVL
jgi:LCP family protein required for cell wall assembly